MKRPLALIGISYFISLTFLNLVPDKFVPFLGCVFVALFFISIIFKKLRVGWTLPLCFGACIVATIIYGIGIINVNKIQKLNNQEVAASGTIYGIPYKKGENYEYTIKINSINKEKIKPFLINLKTDSALEADIFSNITAKITFTPLAPSSKIYYKSKNIFILGKLNQEEQYETKEPSGKNFYYYILKLRQKVISTPKEFLNPQISALINAVLIGEKNDLPNNIKNSFKKIGVYHLLATSGMHVAVISYFIFYVLKKLKVNKKHSALFSASAVFIFMAVAGFSPSVTRASLMFIIYFLGLFITRKPDPLNSLGISVLIICLINPFAAPDISLWLSFLATLGIILCYSPIKDFIYKKLPISKNSIFFSYIVSVISATLCAFIFTIPVTILYFKRISVISPLSNLIFIPGINIILNLSLISNILKAVSISNFLLEPIMMACGYVAYSLMKIAELLAKIPYSSISLEYQEAYIWLIITMVLTALTIIFKPNKKCFKIIALVSLNTALICILLHQILNYNKLSVSFTPCGGGICATLSKNNHMAMVVCFLKNSKLENISESIENSNVKNLDYLNLYIDKENHTHKRDLKRFIKEHPFSSTVINSESPIKSKIDHFHFPNFKKVSYYKSNVKTTLWGNITITNLKIKNHTYIKMDANNLTFLIFPNGGDAKDLPKSWKSCTFLIASGLPINYQNISFKEAIISSTPSDSLINVSKLKIENKKAFSLYHQGNLNIKINPEGKYKIRRLI